MEKRKAEILAKQAKLAELRKQREQRQREFTQQRQSIGEASEVVSPTPGRSADSRRELDSLISSLVDRPGSAALRDGGEASPRGKGSRPSSVLSAAQLNGEKDDVHAPSARPLSQSVSTQTLSTSTLSTVFEVAPDAPPKKEVVTYSKGVQTSEAWTEPSKELDDEETDMQAGGSAATSTPNKRLSRRERARDEEIREQLRKEIEEELKATKDLVIDGPLPGPTPVRFPLRDLSSDELNAVTSSDDFVSFVERSSKVIERALDEDYDVLADYGLSTNALDDEDDNDVYSATRTRKRRSIKETAQFYDDRWSKKRMISDLSFSPKFPELVLAAYTKNPSAPHDPDGILQIWNQHLHSRAEYIFTATSDILTAKFSPFHPNLIVGGTYTGQVLLWDTRSRSGAPVQKTPLTGLGHTHPIYSISIIGTQNAHNILTASTDGIVCSWSVDMLSQPQESLELTSPPPAKTEDLSPTTMSFPQSDPTFFLVGTEEGGIYPCHRCDRAGAKAGTDARLKYVGHAAPVMSTALHPARGPVDLGDLMLSSSLDWSVKLWRVRPPAATSTAASASSGPQLVAPLLDIPREDVVYDAKWSPHRPGVFSLVDGAGNVEVWDLYSDTEVPVARASPSRGKSGVLTRSLNKVAWEEREGRRLATAGMDGVVTVFEVGKGLSGSSAEVPAEEWAGVKRLVGRLEQGERR